MGLSVVIRDASPLFFGGDLAMIIDSIKKGFIASRDHRRLFLLLWLWTVLLGLLATWPAAQWWNTSLSSAPEADKLLERFSAQVLVELSTSDQSSPWNIIMSGGGLLFLLALGISPLVAGGTLELLVSDGSGLTFSRFFEGAGRYFWRFLRLMILGSILMALGVGILAAIGSSLLNLCSKKGWEEVTILGYLCYFALLLIAIGCCTVILDFARIQIVLNRTNQVLKCLFSSCRFLLVRSPGAFLIAAFFGALSAGCLWLGLAFGNRLPGNLMVWILLAIVLQQLFALLRCALRVAALGAYLRYFQCKMPQPLALAEPLAATAPLVADEPASLAASVEHGATQPLD